MFFSRRGEKHIGYAMVPIEYAELDTDELARDSLLLDPSQRVLADEVRLLVEVDHPLVAQVHLVGVRVQPHVGAVREDPALDAADVTGADDGEVVRLAGLEDRIPELEGVVARIAAVDLEPDLRRVAGA